MSPADLLTWQHRLGISGVEAARRLALPLGTWRHYTAGRRRVPECVTLLCRYVEAFGALPEIS